MKDRIKAIMKDLNMSQGDFAKFLGISASILSSIFNGRTNPSLSTVMLIREKIPNISYLWLIDGVGDMYVSDDKSTTGEQVVNKQNGAASSLDPGVSSQESAIAQKNKKGAVMLLEGDGELKNPDKSYRVKEITVFFDDSHFETFVPSKNKT